MAKFTLELPTEILADMKNIYENADEIFGRMTQAGALVAMDLIKNNVPDSFKKSKIMDCLKISEVYKTPSDGGINTKVAFDGYFENQNKQVVPAPLVANVLEYGSTKVQKRPFLRKSFNNAQIEKAMLEAQKKYSGGLLDE